MDQGPATVARVGAVRTALDYAYRGIETDDLLIRLDQLEVQLKDVTPSPAF